MKRVLLVEDEERIARFIEKGLLKYGYQLTVVADGQQALAHASRQTYDIILLDLGLPTISGWTVLETWRCQELATPIIVITAFVDQGDRALALGAKAFMGKPFQFSELLATIRCNLPQR